MASMGCGQGGLPAVPSSPLSMMEPSLYVSGCVDVFPLVHRPGSTSIGSVSYQVFSPFLTRLLTIWTNKDNYRLRLCLFPRWATYLPSSLLMALGPCLVWDMKSRCLWVEPGFLNMGSKRSYPQPYIMEPLVC